MRANGLISDSMAKNMIKKSYDTACTRGAKCAAVSIGLISDSFYPNECVNLESLRERGLVDSDVGLVSITEEGEIDKPLKIYAHSFSLPAVKMVVLTGGEVFVCQNKRF
jgi:ribosomal protein L15